ncbi:NADH-quinone oxidoreductase subunit H [Pseudarthrobacter defluvii]|uniref:NADH-quinone oxidoreductase subunit H n=1 Tax=Pseudarthrobacter defluvii TaxID=410837 RepID=UPI002575D58A|nr:NADH-quinone oxidoreductase subunit H [Pseudarthrobacter defluvii]WJH26598.1 NADH-quinone oxidoreductase subunit H [Pseudarthrobacter defluvii]
MTPGMVQQLPAWGPLAALMALAVVALSGAMINGVLAARSAGRRGGGLAPIAEAARLLRQRRRSTVAADELLRRVGVAGLTVAAALKVAVLPVGAWVVSDLAVGLVWFNAMDVLVWAFVWLAGWGQNSVFPLVGAYRFLALAVAYELPLMFALTAPAAAAGSLRMGDIVAAQDGLWFVVWMPVAFTVFLAAVLAFSLQRPFTAPMSADIAGGMTAELSGVDRFLVLTGRYSLLSAGAGFAVALFLGGGSGPVLPDWSWFLGKTVVLLWLLVALRRRIPQLRPEQLMAPAWVVGLPLVLLQVLVVAVVTLNGRSS